MSSLNVPENVNSDSPENLLIVKRSSKKSEGPPVKKPRILLPEFASNGDRSVPDGCIGDETSDWKGEALPYLCVKIDTNLEDPKEIFQRSYLTFLNNKTETLSGILNLFKDTAYLNLQNCFQHVCKDLIDLNYDRLDDVSIQKVYDMKMKLKSHTWMSDHNLPNEAVAYGIQENLNRFYTQLLYMITIRKRKNMCATLTDGMFQELFMEFVRIFGLEIHGSKNLHKFQLSIDGSIVKSEPNALICNSDVLNFEKNQVIAVVEVKKQYSRDGVDPQIVGELQSDEKVINQVPHVNDNLKAKHIGEMLAVLPHSVFDINGIFGFIVQGTNVTVVSCRPEDGYYEALRTGKIREKQVVVQYSKECNLLSKCGRELLCNVLFDMKKLLEYFHHEERM